MPAMEVAIPSSIHVNNSYFFVLFPFTSRLKLETFLDCKLQKRKGSYFLFPDINSIWKKEETTINFTRFCGWKAKS